MHTLRMRRIRAERHADRPGGCPMNGHTPGPWRVVTVPTSAGACHRIFPESWGETVPDHGGICAYDDRSSLNPHADGEQLANARLIAAAPDLLEALKGVVAFPAGRYVDIEAEEAARAAIAKATEGAR